MVATPRVFAVRADSHRGTRSRTMIGDTVSHYRLVEKLGEGGMGEVWVADDETLHRRVALKAIRTDRRLEPRSRARFLREARILSQLDHPHICRIHDYVEEGGHDFLVLELVQGADLRAAIAGGLDRAAVLDIVGKVNDALVAAHATGVVHRDLKPANVMLTPDGGVKVLDFGLAATAESSPLDHGSPATPHRAEDLGLDLTQEGAAVGTLRYMSPEQARGEPATAASDMYALGLVLVELLAGHPAFPPHRELDALLAHVQRGATVPAAVRSTELGRLAEKLLDPAPTRRPTAVDVAEQLQWIRERPRRTLRRGLLAAGVAIAVMAGVKYTIDLDAQREHAVDERRKAEDLVDFMLGDLRDTLHSVGRLDALGGTADEVLAYLAARGEEEIGDHDTFRRARALLHIGEVRFEQGRFADAGPLFEAACESCEQLRQLDPTNAEWAILLGAAHFWIGNVRLSTDDLDAAEAQFVAYHDLAEELVAQDPTDLRFQMELAYAHTNMIQINLYRDDLEAAIETARESIEIKRAVCAADSANEEWQRDLATGLSWLSGVLDNAGEYDESVALRQEELAIRRRQADADPTDTGKQRHLSISLQRLAYLLSDIGREEESRDLLYGDVEISRSLVRHEPTNVDWRRGLAVSQRTLSAVLLRLGQLDEAALLIGASGSTYDWLADLDPENPDVQLGLAAIQGLLGALHLARAEPERALESTEIAISIAGACTERGDDSSEAFATTGQSLLIRGDAFAALGNDEQARSCWERAAAALSPRLGGEPATETFDVWVRVLVRLRRIEEAEPHARRLVARGYARRDFMALCERLGWMDRWSTDPDTKEK